MTKIIVFKHRTGFRTDDCHEEEMEFEKNATEEEIQEAYIDWVFEQIGDKFTWYEKDSE
mgnify:CR=1 FL=1